MMMMTMMITAGLLPYSARENRARCKVKTQPSKICILGCLDMYLGCLDMYF